MTVTTKNARTDRREHLREYVLACIRENIFSFNDLMSDNVVGKVLRTVSADFRSVLTDLVREGATNAGYMLLGNLLRMTKTKF